MVTISILFFKFVSWIYNSNEPFYKFESGIGGCEEWIHFLLGVRGCGDKVAAKI